MKIVFGGGNMKKFLTIAVSSALLIAASIAIAAVPDFTMYGFPNVVATVIIQPDQNAVLTLGNASINIPAGTFGNVPVKFELLTATPSSWQKYVPSNQKVLYAFAFKITDLTTGALIGKFSKPVIFYFSSSEITSEAQYLDTTPSFEVSKNPIPPKIDIIGQIGTLSHPIAGTPVGWLVTVPE
jgi:hypothetical protein